MRAGGCTVQQALAPEAAAVVKQAVERPGKAPAASWPNNLLNAYLVEPGWEGVNKGF